MTLEDFNLRDHYFTKQRGMNGKKNRVIVRQDEIKFKKNENEGYNNNFLRKIFSLTMISPHVSDTDISYVGLLVRYKDVYAHLSSFLTYIFSFF